MVRTLAESMLALLVMDLGYTEQPTYDVHPLRHQLAWRFVSEVLDRDELAAYVRRMVDQQQQERN